MKQAPRWLMIAGLALIVIIGSGLRLFDLEGQPPGLWLDEAGHGLDSIIMKERSQYPIFLKGNTGREPLYTYLVHIARLSGVTGGAATRLPAAVVGCLTLIFFILLVQRLFGNSYLTLIAAGLFAGSRWHIHYSRLSFRGIFLPFCVVAALYYFLGWLEQFKIRQAVMLGLVLGLSFYTYPPARLLPGFIYLLVGLYWLKFRFPLKKVVILLVVSALVFGLSAAPLIWYFAHNPEAFAARMNLTSIKFLPGNLALNFLKHCGIYLGMFHYRGDYLLRQNIPGQPMLNPVMMGLFTVGLCLTFYRARDLRYTMLLLGIGIFLLPGILSSYGPHALRVLGVPPFVCLVAALPFTLIQHKRVYWWLLGSLFVVIIGVLDGYDYFVRWRQLVLTVPPEADCVDGLNIGEYLMVNWILDYHQLHPNDVILLSPQLFFHATVQYLMYGEVQAIAVDVEKLEAHQEQATVVLLNLHPRNAWWLRDSPKKLFALWWQMHYGLRLSEIYALKTKHYAHRTNYVHASDYFLLELLQTKFPAGSLLQYEQVTWYTIPPSQPPADSDILR